MSKNKTHIDCNRKCATEGCNKSALLYQNLCFDCETRKVIHKEDNEFANRRLQHAKDYKLPHTMYEKGQPCSAPTCVYPEGHICVRCGRINADKKVLIFLPKKP